jgi:hypothetical protein
MDKFLVFTVIAAVTSVGLVVSNASFIETVVCGLLLMGLLVVVALLGPIFQGED